MEIRSVQRVEVDEQLDVSLIYVTSNCWVAAWLEGWYRIKYLELRIFFVDSLIRAALIISIIKKI